MKKLASIAIAICTALSVCVLPAFAYEPISQTDSNYLEIVPVPVPLPITDKLHLEVGNNVLISFRGNHANILCDNFYGFAFMMEYEDYTDIFFSTSDSEVIKATLSMYGYDATFTPVFRFSLLWSDIVG